ncbi:MAG: hypothetical protein COB35_04905 [Gammaproteobacteria bacterium]|nr:MAG: hypothetical protein COB35_04905 [Gammaproteobacteria bacterium]
MSKYFSESQCRICKIVEALVGCEAEGLSTGEIASKISCARPVITKSIANLVHLHWVEKHPRNNDRWRLASKFSQFAQTITMGLQQANQQIQQDINNYNKIW